MLIQRYLSTFTLLTQQGLQAASRLQIVSCLFLLPFRRFDSEFDMWEQVLSIFVIVSHSIYNEESNLLAKREGKITKNYSVNANLEFNFILDMCACGATRDCNHWMKERIKHLEIHSNIFEDNFLLWFISMEFHSSWFFLPHINIFFLYITFYVRLRMITLHRCIASSRLLSLQGVYITLTHHDKRVHYNVPQSQKESNSTKFCLIEMMQCWYKEIVSHAFSFTSKKFCAKGMLYNCDIRCENPDPVSFESMNWMIWDAFVSKKNSLSVFITFRSVNLDGGAVPKWMGSTSKHLKLYFRQ